MVKRIAMFNHKGGVSKTTTTFNIGWMLASKGHRVLMVDADPQCNLTGLILGSNDYEEFERFYQDHPKRNIRAGLEPAFESLPRFIEPVKCIEVNGVEGLYLLPGQIQLSEYDVTLGIAQELSGSIHTLRNLPGSISYLLNETAKKYQADYVLVDLNPSLSSINQNLLMTSDYFIMPATPDYFSVMAVNSLLNVLPRWHDWSQRAQSDGQLKSASYPFPTGTPKFLGTVIQKYRPRKGKATVGFQRWIDEINKLVVEEFTPTLKDLEMALSQKEYNRVKGLTDTYCLAQIPDFNTLIATSQDNATPVFALSDEQIGHVGMVLTQNQKKREEFYVIFSDLTDKILDLTNLP
ncbi:MAG: ParA family protein [Ardenticatenaceae bacterium]